MMENTKTGSPAFTKLIDLASEKLGGKALTCSDDFFAEKENLLKSGRGIFIADKYTDRGKWMDGWESRRKRIPGHDWCIIKLGASGIIRGLDIDTNHFLGNHPPFASIEACNIEGDPSLEILQTEKTGWVEILPKCPLNPGSQNFFEISNDKIWTHLRLNIYPDGGVARLKVYGEVYKNWDTVEPNELIDLAAAVNGAKSVLCNDMFFSHMDNLIMPGRGVNMGDGWETKRNRTPNNRDWVIVKLAHIGEIKKILVDTCHFKGNYPDICSIEGVNLSETKIDLSSSDLKWTEIIPKIKLQADHEHFFESQISNAGPFTHIRLNIFPDGGISRLRLFGFINKQKMIFEELNNLSTEKTIEELHKCCGSSTWAKKLAAKKPFKNKLQLLEISDSIWVQCSKEDGLEAFTHHPKIGDLKSLEKKFASTKEWAGNEQAGVDSATHKILTELAKGNQLYENKFGFIFIVCATGKTANEMLTMLNARLQNNPETEIKIAMNEQNKITHIRLEKLLE